jgi:S1-C subfamily serine protease
MPTARISRGVAGRIARASHRGGALAAAALAALLALPDGLRAQTSGGETLNAVVQIDAQVPANARTAESLGTERQGSGVVIDDSGLIVTIGYLILEADEVTVTAGDDEAVPARIVAYDHESGFGLVRASRPLAVAPLALGSAVGLAPMEPLLVVSRVDEVDAAGVYLVDRREFAGYWEYLLDGALFTAPPHIRFGGAALIDRAGRLVGIGSLMVNDAGGGGRAVPGNMFVPVDELRPIMAELLARGRRSEPPRPWLGLSLEEHRGRVFVTRVQPDGPAEAAGIQVDDVILGIRGQQIEGLADFYRKLWAQGEAGVEVSLDLVKGVEIRPTSVRSGNRYRYLRLDPSY